MYSLVFLGVTSFLLSLVLTPLVRNAFRRWGLVDQPDTNRKQHTQPVPRVGGLPLVIAYLCSLGILLLSNLQGAGIVADALPVALRLFPAVVVIFATGLLDDLRGLKPWHKLLGQLVSAGLAYWAGVRVAGFAGHQFGDWWGIPLTIIWLVVCTNAVNLIDGVDGLATGVGLFAATTTLLAALLQNNFGLAAATIPLVGALFGFLRYNFNPASIFLGDSGSLLIGFLLGCFGIFWSQKSATLLGMTAPLMALAIPLLDTALAVVRRFLGSKSIFVGDRGHIHHRLLDRGFTPRKVALLLYALCSIAAIFSLSMESRHFEGLVLVVFCATAWIGIQHLGYVELGVTGRMFMEGAFRRQLSAQIALHSQQKQLAAAVTPEQCWDVVRNASREFGFHRVRMVFARQTFSYADDSESGPAWEINVPLSDSDFIELSRTFEESSGGIVAPFADVLFKTLVPKLPTFVPSPRESQKVMAAQLSR